MSHTWTRNVLSPPEVDKDTGKPIPAVLWFPKCSRCGCLITQVGKQLAYRATAKDEWGFEEPLCK